MALAFASVMSLDAAAVRLATLAVRLFDNSAFWLNSFVPSAIESISRRRKAGTLSLPTAKGRSLVIASTMSRTQARVEITRQSFKLVQSLLEPKSGNSYVAVGVSGGRALQQVADVGGGHLGCLQCPEPAERFFEFGIDLATSRQRQCGIKFGSPPLGNRLIHHRTPRRQQLLHGRRRLDCIAQKSFFLLADNADDCSPRRRGS